MKNKNRRVKAMRLEKYLSELPLDKRVVLLGKDTEDPLHKAFDSKRVVHAGLIGEPIPVDKQEIIYNESLREKSDLNRHHAVYIHIPFCQTKCLYCGFYQNASRQEAEDECKLHDDDLNPIFPLAIHYI